MQIAIILAGLVTLAGCSTTQIFHPSENCDPKELPLRRTVTAATRSSPGARFQGRLVSADRDSLQLATSVAHPDSLRIFACKDIAYLEYTYRDRERSRRAKKTVGVVAGGALLLAAIVLCASDENGCPRGLWD